MNLFSVITICRNEKNGIARTLESVVNQTYNNYEYIIIDGLSTDGTLEIIESYREKFLKKNIGFTVISEKDTGIYNAMNKGVRLAKGLFVNMMNGGDCFADNDVLTILSKEIDQRADIVYGDANAISLRSNGRFCRYPYKSKNMDTIMKTMPMAHQTAFVRTVLLVENPFDEKFIIAGDYKFFLTMYLNKRVFQYVDIHIADFYLDGISSHNLLLSKKEFALIKEEAGLINSKSLSVRLYLFIIRLIILARKITPRWFRRLFGGGKT